MFGIAVVLGVSLIAASLKMQGMLSKIIMVVGIIAIIKGAILLKAKFMEKLLIWISNQPLVIFRAIASVYIVIGAVILLNA